MTLLFWLSAIVIVYVYAGYPALLAAWVRARGARMRSGRTVTMRELPRVSIVMAVRNEAQRLPARIDNLMALDYPADRRQIVIVSDGSSECATS